MSPTTTNELLQWVALAALLLFILALYRQVGLMLVDRRTYLVGSFGPNVGQQAQRQLLAHSRARRTTRGSCWSSSRSAAARAPTWSSSSRTGGRSRGPTSAWHWSWWARPNTWRSCAPPCRRPPSSPPPRCSTTA